MRSTISILILTSMLAGCGDNEGDEEGTGGTGSGGDSSSGSGGGSDGGSNGECETTGDGTLALNVGKAGDVDAEVTLSGDEVDQTVASGDHELELAGGEYLISAERTATYPSDQRVGYVYDPEPAMAQVCVSDGDTTEQSVSFELLVGSHQLWFTASNGDQLLGSIAGADLLESGDIEPLGQFGGSASLITQNSIAFDGDGNLWSTANDGQITVRPEQELGASGDEEPARVLNVSAACDGVIPCTAAGLAFDADGNLWVGIRDHLLMIEQGDLDEDGVVEPAVTITGDDMDGIEALAFDAEGNLWVASNTPSLVLMYEKDRLDADDEEPADVVIEAFSPEPVVAALGGPTGLAFDSDGALWVGYWGSNVLAKFEPEDLTETADLTPEVQLAVGVLALPESIAFDEQGNLWLPSAAGTVVGIAKDQLVADGDLADGATELSGDALGSLVDLAFNPPPSWSPILGPEPQ